MSTLSDLRAELAQMLNVAGVWALDYIPERVEPPVAVVAAGEPYVEEVFDNKTFDSDYTVRMEVTLIAGTSTNETVTDDLDDMICKVLKGLAGSWEADISQPYQIEANGSYFLASKATITTTISIK